MKSILVIAALIGAAVAQSYFYTTADDFLDMNGVVRDNLKLRAMTDCFLDRKPCDKVAASYKALIPESFANGCRKCNAAQKHLANVYFAGLKQNLPRDYLAFLDKYDPQGVFVDRFMDNIRNY